MFCLSSSHMSAPVITIINTQQTFHQRSVFWAKHSAVTAAQEKWHAVNLTHKHVENFWGLCVKLLNISNNDERKLHLTTNQQPLKSSNRCCQKEMKEVLETQAVICTRGNVLKRADWWKSHTNGRKRTSHQPKHKSSQRLPAQPPCQLRSMCQSRADLNTVFTENSWSHVASGRWQKTTAAWTCKADSAWRLSESAAPCLCDKRLLSGPRADGMCWYTLVLWKYGCLLLTSVSKKLHQRCAFKQTEVTGLREDAGSQASDRIELTSPHSQRLVGDLSDGKNSVKGWDLYCNLLPPPDVLWKHDNVHP